jgi:glycerophosphoryl diester phosphodiesterase
MAFIRVKHFALFYWLALSVVAQEVKPIVIAHRGASGYLPEHTLEAKAMAHAMGADFIEQDLVLTKDDVPIVMHDIHLDTISDVVVRFPDRKRADGRYYALDFTLAEIKQLHATERFNAKTGKPVYANRFPKGKGKFEIPTLEEELQLIQGLNQSTGRKAGIYPEIKQPAWHRKEGHDISKIVLPLLKKYGYGTRADACWLQCFEWDEVKRIRTELQWQGRMVWLLGSLKKEEAGTEVERLRTAAGMADLAKVVDGIGPDIGLVISGKTPAERKITDLVKTAHAHKLAVHAYTLRVDELPKFTTSTEEALKLLYGEAKVDGMFTDFPDVAVKWLRPAGK